MCLARLPPYPNCSQDTILPHPSSFQSSSFFLCNNHQVQPVLPKYCWICSSLQGCSRVPRENWHSFPLQLPIVVDLSDQGGLHDRLPSFCWGFVWLGLTKVLCMLAQPLWVRTYSCPVVSKGHCSCIVTHNADPNTFCSLSCDDSWVFGGRDVTYMSP